MSDRKPSIDELNKQIEREAAARLRRALDRATGRLYPRMETRDEEMRRMGITDYEPDLGATPSPDDMPADYNDGKESDYE